MKIDFSPMKLMNPLAFAQAGAGLVQGVLGAIKAGKAQKALEKMQTPTYKANAGILDYYNKALQRYNVNPYQTNLYKMQEQQANRGVTTGLSALQGRRNAIGGISGLIQGQNDSLLKAGANAEQQQAQALSQLGSAASAKANEGMKEFQYNELAPFERKSSLLAMKASGGNKLLDAGVSNIFGGLQSFSDMNFLDKLYGGTSSSSSGSTRSGSAISGSVLDAMRNSSQRRPYSTPYKSRMLGGG